jgi:glutaredoxin
MRSNQIITAARICAAGFLLLVQTVSQGCQRHTDPAPDIGSPAVPPTVDALPALSLSDQTPNLLLTWIGEDGDFHVVEQITLVPAEHRKQVRVVVTDQTKGTGTAVYVANLDDKRPDGTYAVATLPRAEWEKLGADRRKSRLEALAPGNPGQTAPNVAEPPPPGTADSASAAISAIVYGADWCKPCHDAERYLKSLGVSVTKKNVEESRAAQAEMREKLSRVNRSGAGIPVIDVMGKIFVGYSPGPLKQAVDAARHATAQNRG